MYLWVRSYKLWKELILPQGENVNSVKVIGRYKDADVNVVGTYDNNPLLNTMLYNV